MQIKNIEGHVIREVDSNSLLEADLSGANLSGANLHNILLSYCTGNGIEINTIVCDAHIATWHNDILAIGCCRLLHGILGRNNGLIL